MHVCLPDPMHAQVYCFDPGRHICSAWIHVYVYKICDIYIYTLYLYIYIYICVCVYAGIVCLSPFAGFSRGCARFIPVVHVACQLCTFRTSWARFTKVVHVTLKLVLFHKPEWCSCSTAKIVGLEQSIPIYTFLCPVAVCIISKDCLKSGPCIHKNVTCTEHKNKYIGLNHITGHDAT